MRTKPNPQNPNSAADVFSSYLELVKILRTECPWDKEQTSETLIPLMIEEVFETADAVYDNDNNNLKEELGDVFLHIVMQSLIAEEEDLFNINEVMMYSFNKMVRRHPHIFADTSVNNTTDVLRNWESIKKKEGKDSVLSGVPKALPGLLKAQRVQEKASKVGFDWDNKTDVWNKVFEELEELKKELFEWEEHKLNENKNKTEQTFEKVIEEFGDLMFSLVNAARFSQIDAETALHKTINKFIKRFRYIEEQCATKNINLIDMTLPEMDELWNEAKHK